MPASADILGHLDRSYAELRSVFLDWTRLPAEHERTDIIESYFQATKVGDTRRVGTASVLTERRRADADAPQVVVVGSHDVTTLNHVENGPDNTGDLRGAGTGRLLGSTMAFIEGLKAVVSAGHEPVNLLALSVGPGDSVQSLVERYAPDTTDVVVMTDAVAWSPEHPTITAGSRGRLDVTITVTAGRPVHDMAYAGATLNPLNRLVDLIASLRDERGRIALPDFYARAHRPDGAGLAELSGATWIDRIGGSPPSGSLSPLERATQWPVINLIELSQESTDNASPGSATANLAIYLVPDQRPVEVERSLRSWLQEQVPDSLSAHMQVDQAARPYLVDAGDPAFAAQMRALQRVHGRTPIVVPAGGTIGAGELHFATDAPVLFAGICGPLERWGSTDEALSQRLLDAGVTAAAEFCMQLPRRTSIRST